LDTALGMALVALALALTALVLVSFARAALSDPGPIGEEWLRWDGKLASRPAIPAHAVLSSTFLAAQFRKLAERESSAKVTVIDYSKAQTGQQVGSSEYKSDDDSDNGEAIAERLRTSGFAMVSSAADDRLSRNIRWSRVSFDHRTCEHHSTECASCPDEGHSSAPAAALRQVLVSNAAQPGALSSAAVAAATVALGAPVAAAGSLAAVAVTGAQVPLRWSGSAAPVVARPSPSSASASPAAPLSFPSSSAMPPSVLSNTSASSGSPSPPLSTSASSSSSSAPAPSSLSGSLARPSSDPGTVLVGAVGGSAAGPVVEDVGSAARIFDVSKMPELPPMMRNINWAAVQFPSSVRPIVVNGSGAAASGPSALVVASEPSTAHQSAQVAESPNSQVDALKASLDPYPTVFCDKCQHFKPPRTHHCSSCGRCVTRMDHHCIWLNNCVGLSNHRFFLQFLVYVSAALFYFLVLEVVRTVNLGLPDPFSLAGLVEIAFSLTALGFLRFAVELFITQANAVATNYTVIEDMFVEGSFTKYNRGSAHANVVELLGPSYAKWLLPL
jgi:hypothetical protein